jgi:nitrite reductase/ring-hydroxylating ferredoxin subunit
MADFTVARVTDFPPGSRRVVRTGRVEIGVFNVGGRYFALPNVCAHQFGPLCEGVVTGTFIANAQTGWRSRWVHEGAILTCPWHSLEYDITTGRCLAYPAIKLRQYPVRVEDGCVVVSV